MTREEKHRARTAALRQRYHLYLWGRRDSAGFRPRGRHVQSYTRYKDLVADAQRRAVAAGYPKSRWMDLFDWNLT